MNVELAKMTSMNYAFAPNLDFQGALMALAILSRFPIEHIDHRSMKTCVKRSARDDPVEVKLRRVVHL